MGQGLVGHKDVQMWIGKELRVEQGCHALNGLRTTNGRQEPHSVWRGAERVVLDGQRDVLGCKRASQQVFSRDWAMLVSFVHALGSTIAIAFVTQLFNIQCLQQEVWVTQRL